jgi:hypothetical protein
MMGSGGGSVILEVDRSAGLNLKVSRVVQPRQVPFTVVYRALRVV